MPADIMAILIESCLRASVVLATGWALTAAMRHTAASTRHFVWSSAIAGAILATAISSVGPRVIVPVSLPYATARPAAASASHPQVAPNGSAPELPSIGAVPSATESASNPAVAARVGWLDASLLAVFLWGAGALAVLAFLVAGTLGSWWIRRTARPLQAPWVDEAQVLAEAFEIPRSVRIVESPAVTMPMVCGVWRPAIVMPAAAADWSDDRRRVVVLHELAHVKRRDCLTQALAQIVCAAYWFNPIVWFAARRLRVERERACDDFVLAAGEKGPDYAAHLLEIAQTMRHRGAPALAGLAMARPTQLEGRLLAILDPAIRRSSAFRTRLAALGLVLAVTFPAAAIELASSVPAAAALEMAAAVDPPLSTPGRAGLPGTAQATPSPAPAPSPTPVPVPAPSARPRSQDISDVLADAGAARISEQIGAALGVELGQQITTALSAQNNAPADPKTIDALIGALSDSDPDVREMVVSTLGRMRDPRIVGALLPMLKDGDAEVREQAVFALARTGDARATAALATLIDDASPDVREQAVHALGQSRNRDAVPALTKALKDSSADVREQAAFALGQIHDVSAVDPLLEALKDSSPDVREQAAFALGQLRDRRAVDGLMSALTDSSADVREQAAFALGQLRDPKALAALTAALRDAVADVREQAAFAIGQLSGQ
jgi:HEAT repeat protein/beta-lactamase regulating signal transducer with metallopeptidase domain